MTDNYERCSCGARYKSKCVEESASGSGKVCKELKAEQTIQEWSKDFISKQETLPT